jgi:hypothetical protein
MLARTLELIGLREVVTGRAGGVLTGRLALTGLRRGLTEGSRGWLMVGVTLTAARVLGRVLAEPVVRETIELRSGDAIEVRVVAPPPR